MESTQAIWSTVVNGAGPYFPRALSALAILVVAWLLSKVVRLAVSRAGLAGRLDQRLGSAGLGETLAGVGGAVVWLLALPALLGVLQLDALLVPVNSMMTGLLGFIPRLVGAFLVFAIGFLVARIVSQIVVGLLKAGGSEKLAAKIGMSTALGSGGLAGLIGMLVFALILLPTVAGALQPLGLDSVTQPVSRLVDTVLTLIPRLVAAAVVVAVAALIGRALGGVVSALLTGMGFDHVPAKLGLPVPQAGSRTASEMAGWVLMAAILMASLTQACEIIGFSTLTDAVGSLGVVLAKVLVGLFILGLGLWLSNLAAGAVHSSGVTNARILAVLTRAGILFFVAALALRQMGLPSEIVTIAFSAVIGAIAIAAAIAFGVGGRQAAGKLLDRAEASFNTDKAH